MNRNDQSALSGGVVVAYLLIVLAGIIARTAEGQDRTQLVIAQAAVAECGWTKADCHTAVWVTLRNRARLSRGRRTIAETARGYCSAWRLDDRRTRWVLALDGDQRPDGWPEHVSWERHRRKWARIYRRAGQFLDGRIGSPCRGRPLHFGGPMDDHRARRKGWRRMDCGDTGKQRFWTWKRRAAAHD